MSAPAFLHVSENIARNPVARNFARINLRQAVRDFSTRLYMLAEGEDIRGDIRPASELICVALAIMEARKQPAPDLQAGMNALIAMSEDGKWSTEAAGVLDVALQEAMAIYSAASAMETQRAYLRVTA